MTKIKSSCKTLPRMHYVFVLLCFVFFLINISGNFFPSEAQSISGEKKRSRNFIGEKTYIYNEIMPNPKLKYLQDSP